MAMSRLVCSGPTVQSNCRVSSSVLAGTDGPCPVAFLGRESRIDLEISKPMQVLIFAIHWITVCTGYSKIIVVCYKFAIGNQ
jgi:hypothetical protein